jgi:hypothetical protein
MQQFDSCIERSPTPHLLLLAGRGKATLGQNHLLNLTESENPQEIVTKRKVR